jgi:hypothetical protein
LERLIKDQSVRVRRAGTNDDWCPAKVVLVSGNGVSAVLALDGAVSVSGGGCIAAILPLLIENGTATGVIVPDEYEIEIASVRARDEVPRHGHP